MTTKIIDADVILEACPPVIDDRDKSYALLRRSFSVYNSFHAISVPDLQDESEFKRQRDRVPNEEFAIWLKELTSKPLSLYKVSVSATREEFSSWLDRAAEIGCNDVFIVGGDTSDKDYKKGALQVGEAADIAREKAFRCGGIIIPTRRRHFAARPASVDETERLLTKINDYGFGFFSTQILYESEWMCCLLLDLVRRVDRAKLPKVFLTLSPLVCAEDIAFSKKTLGVFVPRDIERLLKGVRSMREASISVLVGVWDRISSFAKEIGYRP